jgi:hypothetical protein
MSVHKKLHRTILNLHIDHLDHLVTLMRRYTVIAERVSLVEEHFRLLQAGSPTSVARISFCGMKRRTD